MAQNRSPTPNASFPSPLPAADSQQAPSIISSQMTDVGSEDGDEFHTEGLPSGLRPDTATSTEPHRPGSALSSQTRLSTRSPPSRYGMSSPGSLTTLRAGGIQAIGGSVTSSSRPVSSTSRTSRTHVPSLASQAFFHPMSSQRLQAQRSPRPSRGRSTDGEAFSDADSTTQRHSLATDATEFQNPTFHHDHNVQLATPSTRNAEYDDRTTENASPEGNTTLRSVGDSERPLQQSMYVNVGDEPVDGTRLPKDNMTLSANLMRTNGSARNETPKDDHFESASNSPSLSKPIRSATPEAGINYQYFSGNTVFCWGGRLQNTRERPINIASGLLVIIPSVLFLVYS